MQDRKIVWEVDFHNNILIYVHIGDFCGRFFVLVLFETLVPDL